VVRVSNRKSVGPHLLAGGPQPNTSNDTTRAMIIMTLGMLVVPLMDVLAKNLSTNHAVGPVTITFIRFVGQAVLLAMVIPFTIGARKIMSKRPGLNILRGVLVGCAVSLFFTTVKYMPLADAIAIFFVEPMVLILLSAVFLREFVGWRRAVASMFGFFGALLIIQPSYEIFGAISLMPLGTATFFAIYLLVSKKAGVQDHPLTMQLWAGIGGAMVCSVILLAAPLTGIEDMAFRLPITEPVVWQLAGVILIATVAHLLIVMAFTKADASILAPFQYLEIVTMTIAGYMIFGEFPTPAKWLGIAIIIGSGLFIFLRERRLSRGNGSV